MTGASLATVLAVTLGAQPTLQAEISKARRESPRTFAALAAAKQKMPELDARKRGRLVPVAPMLKSLGPAGLLPMLEELSAESLKPALTGTTRLSWRIGLLEAVGALRDRRSAAVLREVLAAESTPDLVRASANALGKLENEEALAILLPLAEAQGAKQLPVIAGLGECRRLKAAEALERVLASGPDDPTTRATVKALGQMGSSWAWQLPSLTGHPEKQELRALVARTLISAFLKTQGETRRAAETELLVVDPADLPALMAAARSQASEADLDELDRLARRLARNPLRASPR